MTEKVSKNKLLAKQNELIERVMAIKKDFEGGLDPDLEEQAQQLENYEVLQRLLEQANAQLNKIDEQLKKMEVTSSN